MKKMTVYIALFFLSIGSALAQMPASGKMELYINFESRKSDISAESMGAITEVVKMMQDDKSLRLSVEGHSDNGGNVDSNLVLSERRARAVMNKIIAGGIDKSRLSCKGWGDTHPLTDNNTEDAKARNRRVELVKQ